MAETKTISIHAAQEGCDVQGQIFHQSNLISIHAAQEGCDKGLTVQDGAEVNFNPRSPRGLRLGNLKILWGLLNISIHAAQEGCDGQCSAFINQKEYFNPRSPRGLRLKSAA